MNIIKKRQSGFTLVEVAISVVIITATIVVSYRLATSSIMATTQNGIRLQAYYLATEGIEATRAIKRNNSIISDGTYGISLSSGTYTFSSNQDENPIDNFNFHRSVSIVTDGSIYKITSMVWWGNVSTDEKKSIKLISYIGVN